MTPRELRSRIPGDPGTVCPRPACAELNPNTAVICHACGAALRVSTEPRKHRKVAA